MSVTTFPEVMQDMAESAYRQQVYIVAETQMHVAPWLFDDEGWDKSRLKAAIELVCTGKVTQTADGWHVEGSSREGYDIPGNTLACPCKAAAHNRKTSVCKHRVAVELARRVQQAYPQDTPLPFGPTTVDERLAQAPTLAERQRNYTQASLPPTAEDEDPQFVVSTTPQEDRMAPDEDQYIPEPDDAPIAVMDDPKTTAATPRPLPGPVLLPSLDAQTLRRSMQEWSAQRQVIRSFLQQELKEGVDFYRLQVRGKDANPSLSKAGAEKFLGLFQLQASFAPDLLTWEMLGKPTDHVIYICTLRTRSGEIVGEGRGSRSLKKDSGDTNKAIKMSEKSALIDAVLRTGALSEVYTQDAEDMQEEPAKAATPAKPTSQDLRGRIWGQVQKMDGTIRTREQVEAFIKAHTGMDLHPDFYEAILGRLEGRV